jgi:precorrin-4/cobalt-precorrin-4 C11-methyltransferase
MVHFVGAGSGAVDLITVRGAKLLGQADVVIYAGSLVNPELLSYTKPGCAIYNSAEMTLEQVMDVITAAEAEGKITVRLHTGDPSIFGAVREQYDELAKRGISYDVCPGVSSFFGAAASLKTEYTLPDVSQTVIITRAAGRTPFPSENPFAHLRPISPLWCCFSAHRSLRMCRPTCLLAAIPAIRRLQLCIRLHSRRREDFRCTLETLHETVTKNGLTKTSLIIVGNCLGDQYQRSIAVLPRLFNGVP